MEVFIHSHLNVVKLTLVNCPFCVFPLYCRMEGTHSTPALHESLQNCILGVKTQQQKS